MQTLTEVHADLERQAAEKNTQEMRVIENIPMGKAIRQGDVYLRRIEKVPSEAIHSTNDLQLAPGNTKGSRHILQQSSSLRMFINPNETNALQGPIIVSDEKVVLTHPEHAHFTLPAGIYSTTYQRDFAQEEIARVRD
jgi:hypothetical protein